MGRDAQKAAGNVWYDARMKAAKYDDALNSREVVAERLGIGVDAIRRIENNVNKTMPVDTAVLMADLYNAPELENYYCLNECPIGCRKALSCEAPNISQTTIRLMKHAKPEKLAKIRDLLLDIAEDGEVTDDELDDMQFVMDTLGEISKTISEMLSVGRKAMKGDKKHD